MSPIQQFKSEHSRRIAIVLGVVGGLWLAMTIYFLVDSKPSHTVGKSTVTIHATSPVAAQATSIASTTEAPMNNHPAIKKVTGDPFDPFLDPVGDVTWPLMLLLTIGWCVRVRLKKQ